MTVQEARENYCIAVTYFLSATAKYGAAYNAADIAASTDRLTEARTLLYEAYGDDDKAYYASIEIAASAATILRHHRLTRN